MPRRDLTRFADLPHHSFGSVAEFLAAPVPDGILTIDYHGSPLDLLVQRRPGADTTLVLFHSALSPNMQTLPVFSGLGVTRGLDVNVVCVADPSLELDDELNIGWFSGNSRQPLQQDLPGVLRHVVEGLAAEHLAFFGTSAGGFAALLYAAHFPGSLAVPVNPQIILRDFSDVDVLSYGRSAFGAPDLAAARTALTERISGDLRETYAGRGDVTIGYVQNLRDGRHFWRHLSHFMLAVQDTADLLVLADDWGMGHVPPPKSVNRTILETVAGARGDWAAALGRLGFRGGLTFEDLKEARAALPPTEAAAPASAAPGPTDAPPAATDRAATAPAPAGAATAAAPAAPPVATAGSGAFPGHPRRAASRCAWRIGRRIASLLPERIRPRAAAVARAAARQGRAAARSARACLRRCAASVRASAGRRTP
ncbi:hypothetical protein GCM10022377_25970 [Zhihengliuella alba]|uniref:Alpha/beta hydrolase n=1 Tax=Zhihengliuella alba TaxID=547018 RepID=A0ABP7E2K2_9MICC